MQFFRSAKPCFCSKVLRLATAIAFTITLVAPPPLYAQNILSLPNPGAMVPLSPSFTPTILRGIEIDPQNPFKFEFIVDRGDQELSQEELRAESEKVIRYFLAGLALPEDKLWVNLSPYENDRIVDDTFGQTEMGRDLLAQDYMLKQITASLIYPEDDFGRAFWQKIYKKAYEKFQTTNIPINTFNKVWIVPDKATVYAQDSKALVIESTMNVMLEQDYLSLEKNLFNDQLGTQKQKESTTKDVSAISSQVVREVVLPELLKEVNEGKNFAQLRQIYNSLILANWFKANLRQAVLNKVYSDQGKVGGISTEDKEITKKIYDQYLAAFKKGVCDFMKIEYDPYMKKQVPRKYFSGGCNLKGASPLIVTGTQGEQRAGSAIQSWTRRSEDRLFGVYTFMGEKTSTMLNKMAAAVTPERIRNSALAKILPLIVAASTYTSALMAHTNSSSGEIANQMNVPGHAIVVGESGSPDNTYDASDDIVPSDKKNMDGGDEGFLSKMSIADKAESRIAGIFYGKASYSKDKVGRETALSVLYSSSENGAEIGKLSVIDTRYDKIFTFAPKGSWAVGLGLQPGESVIQFNSEAAFEAGARNLLLAESSREEFASRLLDIFDNDAAESLKSEQPDIYNLMQSLDAAGLALDSQEVGSLASKIATLSELKTQYSPYIREVNVSGHFYPENQDFYKLSLFEIHGNQLVKTKFELQLKIRISKTKAPTWLFRIVHHDNTGYRLFAEGDENFTLKTTSLEFEGNRTWYDASDYEFLLKNMGRVAAELPVPSFSDPRGTPPSKIDIKMYNRIQEGIALLEGASGKAINDAPIINISKGVFGGVAPSQVEEVVVQNGSAAFTVDAPPDVYKQGKTVFLGDRSGTMVWQKLQVAVAAFGKVFSNRNDRILVGDMTDQAANIVETTAEDFVKASEGFSKGAGATFLKNNVLKASDLAGDFGTIVQVTDVRPDDQANKIEDWPMEKVKKEIFEPWLKMLQERHQRVITYYIEKAGEAEAPLVTLMKDYAATHPEDPIFFTIQHQDNASIDGLVKTINDQYGQSARIAGEITSIPIGDIGGLSNVQLALKDAEGNVIKAVDQDGQSLSQFVSNDTVRDFKGTVTLDLEKGTVEGYQIPQGAKKITTVVVGNQTQSVFAIKDYSIFPFNDESNSMRGARIATVKDLFRNMSPGHKAKIIGMGSFSQGEPTIELFNLNRDISRQVDRFVDDLDPNGNTYLLQGLKPTAQRLKEYCRETNRPKRGEVGFEPIYVPIIGDGATTGEKSSFSSEEIEELYELGIVFDILIIGNKIPFHPKDYTPRIYDMFNTHKAQGLFELAMATGGKLYDYDLPLGRLYTKYAQSLGRSFTGEIPSGAGYVQITSYDEAGKVIDQGMYKAETKGDLKKFQEKTTRELLEKKNKEVKDKIFDPAKAAKKITSDIKSDMGANLWTTPGEGNKYFEAAMQRMIEAQASSNLVALTQEAIGTLAQTEISDPAAVSSASANAAQPEYGGIDFKTDQFDLKTKGEGIDMNIPFDESMLQNFNPDTVAPIIIQIIPIANPQMILGLSGSDSQTPS